VSLNISSRLLAVGDVKVVIRPEKCPVRMRNALIRYLKSGVLSAHTGLAHQLAVSILRQCNQPFVSVLHSGTLVLLEQPVAVGSELHKRMVAVRTAWELADKVMYHEFKDGRCNFYVGGRKPPIPVKETVKMLTVPCAKRDAVVAPYIDAIKNNRPFEVIP